MFQMIDAPYFFIEVRAGDNNKCCAITQSANVPPFLVERNNTLLHCSTDNTVVTSGGDAGAPSENSHDHMRECMCYVWMCVCVLGEETGLCVQWYICMNIFSAANIRLSFIYGLHYMCACVYEYQ